MPTIIELPQVGESVTEGVIGKWLKKPGERVDKYEPLVEVMTDKVNMEVPSPLSGVLVRTLVEEGATVPMGAPICEMEVLSPAEAAPPDSHAPERSSDARPAVDKRARVGEFMESVRSVGPTGSGEGGQGLAGTDIPAKAVPPPESPLHPRAQHQQQARDAGLSPVVRRLVEQHGVDVSLVQGTGIGGRVTKDDVLAYVERRDKQGFIDSQAPGVESGAPPPRDQGMPLTPLRKTIADHMARSHREVPPAWTMVEVDVTGLVKARAAHKDVFEKARGLPLTYLAFAANAVAGALREYPRVNARWDGDRITIAGRVNLGIAAATDAGLIVPVIHDADRLSVAELAVRIHQLAEAARSGTIKLPDVQGGTLTLNNTGALGSVVSVPIVNHPQAAIVTTEAIVKRPVVVGDDAIAVRSMMNVCMSFDHRVLDGAEASAFLRSVKQRLEAITPSAGID
ncbi:MAG: 2-oxo acid dehydrogenase subunit E2 [SAR202 cluster bacterium]|nr:2-oxo acid dehydrogenase subunit E2 [SAR202 cluster bacterium]